ncbi:MAG: DNA-directed RNA polymerase subunit K [Candidatus Aenigmatarchaeota archaeon]|nr:MAG: DNA-directed RNA polymerase subunit K [Candidatus Aenigmarchaeota archaeon]
MRPKEDYTHFEKVRILSARALQISQGAPILVRVPSGMTEPLDIAKLEWEKELIPIDSRRISMLS